MGQTKSVAVYTLVVRCEFEFFWMRDEREERLIWRWWYNRDETRRRWDWYDVVMKKMKKKDEEMRWDEMRECYDENEEQRRRWDEIIQMRRERLIWRRRTKKKKRYRWERKRGNNFFFLFFFEIKLVFKGPQHGGGATCWNCAIEAILGTHCCRVNWRRTGGQVWNCCFPILFRVCFLNFFSNVSNLFCVS